MPQEANIPPATPRIPASRSRGAWITLLLTIVLGLAFDLGTKSWAFKTLADQPFEPDRTEVLKVLKENPDEIMRLVPDHQPTHTVGGLLDLSIVLNAGAVFGTGQGKRWFFISFTGVALLFALWLFAAWTTSRDRVAHIAIGLVIAGGLGNLYDRIMYACVRDFLHPLPGVRLPFGLHWTHGSNELWPYVSNVADALLLIGIAILMVKLWRGEKKPAGAEAAE